MGILRERERKNKVKTSAWSSEKCATLSTLYPVFQQMFTFYTEVTENTCDKICGDRPNIKQIEIVTVHT